MAMAELWRNAFQLDGWTHRLVGREIILTVEGNGSDRGVILENCGRAVSLMDVAIHNGHLRRQPNRRETGLLKLKSDTPRKREASFHLHFSRRKCPSLVRLDTYELLHSKTQRRHRTASVETLRRAIGGEGIGRSEHPQDQCCVVQREIVRRQKCLVH